MIFVNCLDKLPRLIGKTVNVYAPEWVPPCTHNGRFLDRIIVSKIEGSCVCGESLVSGIYQSYNAEDYVQFFNAYKDDFFDWVDDKLGLEDLYQKGDSNA